MKKNFSKKQTILFFLLLLILVGGALFWFSKKDTRVTSGENNTGEEITQNETAEGEGDEPGEPLDADDPLNTPETKEEERKTSEYVVDQEICDNECSVYNKNPEALKYCQAVCGLTPEEGAARPQPKDCENLAEIEKDICLRDKAVVEKNGSLCEDIIDQSLRMACHNRIAEEQFD